MPGIKYPSLLVLRAECLLREIHGRFHGDPWLRGKRDAFKGERAVIIGNGPSLNMLDLSKIRGEITFGTNGIYTVAEEIDLTFFCYVSLWWYKNNVEAIRNVHCQRRFIPRQFSELDSGVPTSWMNVYYPRNWYISSYVLPVPARFGYSPHSLLYAGGSVTFLSLQIAYWLGFKQVVMIGFDHSYTKNDATLSKPMGGLVRNENSHFRGDYMPKDHAYHVSLHAMERGYQLAKDVYVKAGREIVNATPGSKLDVFPKVTYDELF